jgi:hypothetical protein
MLAEYERNWYSFTDLQKVTGESTRTLRRRVADLPASHIRVAERADRGRPEKLYHYAVDPRLQAYHQTEVAPTTALPTQPDQIEQSDKSYSATDLALAELRQLAIKEFEARKGAGQLSVDAAESICRAWETNPRTREVEIEERLRHHKRDANEVVALGKFSTQTLYRWVALYKEGGLLGLCPNRKGACGRTRVEISDELLKYVHMTVNSTVRANVARSLPYARATWPGEWPDVSLDTWLRRLNEFDPRHASRDLMHSIKKFRMNHSPDIEIDWMSIAYNGLWMIDDIQQDWYALDNRNEWLRPYAYAIVRARTRQWVSVCSSECPITQGQVRSLIGWSMVSPAGGIPDEIKFEHGTVAGDARLFNILGELECKVSHTSMDSGRVHSGACPDVGQGHPQGKGLIERHGRELHDQAWAATLQVGPEERHTAPVRLEKYQRALLAAKEAGHPIQIPVGAQMHAYIRELMKRHNDTPCEALKFCAFPGEDKPRYQTPNEAAKELAASAVRVMPEQYLPLFAEKGNVVPVTKNGCKINNAWYGKFDEGLQELSSATCFTNPDIPDVIYVEELGRCISAYAKTAYGDSSQIEDKRRIEQTKRNKLEEAYQSALATGKLTILETTQIFHDPVPTRPKQMAESAELTTRVAKMNNARASYRTKQEASAARFTMDSAAPAEQTFKRRGGLLARSQDLSNELAAVGAPDANTNTAQEETESWQQ